MADIFRDESGVLVVDNAKFTEGHHLDASLIRDAAKADQEEHNMTLKQAFKMHKKAIFWSMALSAALIMEGYDVVVIASFYGQPWFLRRFGEVAPNSPNGYVISAPWQSGLGNGSSAGCIIGLMINGWAAERYGAKAVMMTSLVALAGFIFIPVFSTSLISLTVGEILCGIPWGVFQTLTTNYAAEVCPIQLRGYLTAYINLCWGCGILLSSGVVAACLNIQSDWGWRLPFVIQWVWILPLLIIVFLAPTSPWWLVRQGRLEDAEKSIRRLTNADLYTEKMAKDTVAMMVHTTELEKSVQSGTSYADCFKGTDRRRTEIVMMVFAMQLLSGENLIGQGVQFLQQAGIATKTSYNLNIGLNSMFIIGTIFSWGLLTIWGRRTLYAAGMIMMAAVLLTQGILGFVHTNGANWAIGILLILLNFAYNSTLGPLCYTIIGEIPSTRLKQKSIVLSRCAYQLMNIICGIIVPRMLSPKAWNWGAKAGLFWAGSATLSTVYIFLRLPESRGRSYGELDILFEEKVPAWRFSKTKVDQFALDERSYKPNKQGSVDSKDDISKEPISP